ncbi:hypothetical protein E5288_WYG012056 [Bos mutus]|uniref:Uncharacterized protein n=1 Tax=Bos mutus TaxID=72004 RepID=A0A6B0R491_9CETA|nr:hypothetical protein [Bos mutus]
MAAGEEELSALSSRTTCQSGYAAFICGEKHPPKSQSRQEARERWNVQCLLEECRALFRNLSRFCAVSPSALAYNPIFPLLGTLRRPVAQRLRGN